MRNLKKFKAWVHDLYTTEENLHAIHAWGDVDMAYNTDHPDKLALVGECLQKIAHKKFPKSWQGHKSHKKHQLQENIKWKLSQKKQWQNLSLQNEYIAVYQNMNPALHLLPIQIAKVVQVQENWMILDAKCNGLFHPLKSRCKSRMRAQGKGFQKDKPYLLQELLLIKQLSSLLQRDDAGIAVRLGSLVSWLEPSLFLLKYRSLIIYSNGIHSRDLSQGTYPKRPALLNSLSMKHPMNNN